MTTTQRYSLVLAFLALAISFQGCGPQDLDSTTPSDDQTDVEPKPGLDPPLSEQQVAAFDSVPAFPVNIDSVALPGGGTVGEYIAQHGMTAMTENSSLKIQVASANTGLAPTQEDIRKNIIALMLKKAGALMDRSTVFSDGPNSPLRSTGYAYVFGGKTDAQRTTPAGACGNVQENLYGVDASGFVALSANAAGLRISAETNSAENIRNLTTWNALLMPHGLRMVEVADTTKPQSGDIIYWRNAAGTAYHVGIVGLDGQTQGLAVFHSNGTNGYDRNGKPKSGNELASDCDLNVASDNRGPHSSAYAKAILPTTPSNANAPCDAVANPCGFGTSYGLLRMVYDRIEVTPKIASINPGETQVFSAKVYDENNRDVTGERNLSWAVQGTSVVANATQGSQIAVSATIKNGTSTLRVTSQYGGMGVASVNVSGCAYSYFDAGPACVVSCVDGETGIVKSVTLPKPGSSACVSPETGEYVPCYTCVNGESRENHAHPSVTSCDPSLARDIAAMCGW